MSTDSTMIGYIMTVVAACLVKLGYSAEDAIAPDEQVRSGALSIAAQRDFIYRFRAAQT